jgi:hypothetical protein
MMERTFVRSRTNALRRKVAIAAVAIGLLAATAGAGEAQGVTGPYGPSGVGCDSDTQRAKVFLSFDKFGPRHPGYPQSIAWKIWFYNISQQRYSYTDPGGNSWHSRFYGPYDQVTNELTGTTYNLDAGYYYVYTQYAWKLQGQPWGAIVGTWSVYAYGEGFFGGGPSKICDLVGRHTRGDVQTIFPGL